VIEAKKVKVHEEKRKEKALRVERKRKLKISC
jgi:hypothetical protein